MEEGKETGRPVAMPAEFCRRHSAAVVKAAGIPEDGPWKARLVVAAAVIFQGASANPTVQRKIEGDITRIGELGCLPCRLPARFSELLGVARGKDLGQLKALGDKWVQEASNGGA